MKDTLLESTRKATSPPSDRARLTRSTTTSSSARLSTHIDTPTTYEWSKMVEPLKTWLDHDNRHTATGLSRVVQVV